METILLWIIAFMLTAFVVIRILELRKINELDSKYKEHSKVNEKILEVLEKISYNTFNITKNTYKWDKKVWNY